MMRPTRALSAALLILWSLACATGGPTGSGAGPTAGETAEAVAEPALVVLVAVDQMRTDYIDRFGEQFTGGFRTLLQDGAVLTNARQDHAITTTAPGHAAMLSGLYPRDHGIVDNSWYDRTLERSQGSVSDPGQPLVGLPDPADGPGASPFQFRGTSLTGWLRDRFPDSIAVSVSRKDRSAILMAPEAEHVYWWHAPSGRFVTSAYYRDTLPGWVEELNAADWLGAFAGGSWELLAPESAYELSRPDDAEGERGPRGFGNVFPHPLPTDRRALASSIQTTPFMDEATLDLARAAITALDLGGDGATDVLAVGLSSTDAIGHAFGPHSREVQDQLLRVDRMLGEFFDLVDQTVGLDRTLIVLTSDHGVVPLPEYSRELGEDAERVVMAEISRGINQHVGERLGDNLGEESWFRSGAAGWIHVDRDRAAELGVDADAIIAAAREHLESRTDVAAVFSRQELLEDREPSSELELLVRRSFYADRVGDLYLVHQPLSQWGGSAATHGSPYDYDRRVPLIFRGPGIRPGLYDEPAAVVDIAPTLAAILGLEAPAGLEGSVREEIIDWR
jgi:predicted AlkP superfamily pyrophosphatase or phosphodiesterase